MELISSLRTVGSPYKYRLKIYHNTRAETESIRTWLAKNIPPKTYVREMDWDRMTIDFLEEKHRTLTVLRWS